MEVWKKHSPTLAHTQVYVLSDTKGNQVKVCSRVAQWGNTVPHHWTELSIEQEGGSMSVSCLFICFLMYLLTYKGRNCIDASHFRIGQLLSSTGNY